MSTRSVIAIANQNNTVQAIYCHSDGYVEHNGRILQENYKNRETVEQLIELGDLSSLAETINECTAYHRDRGEPAAHTMSRTYDSYQEMLENEFEDSDREFVYVFLRSDAWTVINHRTAEIEGPQFLSNVIAELNRSKMQAV